MSVCPKNGKPCCDDLCYGGGCMQMDGYPMLEVCSFCRGLIDETDPGCNTCSCDEYGDEP